MATNREVFDAIAATWYGVRHWPLLPHEIEELASRWRHGRLLNLGCGVGSDFLPFKGSLDLSGLDISRGMLRQAVRHTRRHGLQASLVQGDLVSLPFADDSFDYAVAVACYHHIEGTPARVQALSELRRVLRAGGEAFISVWNHAQPRFEGTPQDQQIPWGEGTLNRYYHLFTQEELALALTECGFDLVRVGFGSERRDAAREDPRNICALVRKLSL
ncbi:MAG: class I SAM-dependent methyltransferase [Dehalococcoidia bacterium]|nr:class I SAM-dependent methyltransferase [Dehalococcoidia bacterium]